MRGSRSRRKKGRREVVDGESRAGPVGVKPVEWWSGGGLRAKASASASASTVHALAGVVQYSIEPSHPAPQCSAVPAARRGTRRRRLGTRPPPPPTGRAKTQPRRDAASSRDLAPGPSGQWEDPSVSERALVAGRQAEAEAGASESSVSVLAAYALDRSQRLRRTRQLHLSILNLHHLHHLYHPLSLRLSPPLSPLRPSHPPYPPVQSLAIAMLARSTLVSARIAGAARSAASRTATVRSSQPAAHFSSHLYPSGTASIHVVDSLPSAPAPLSRSFPSTRLIRLPPCPPLHRPPESRPHLLTPNAPLALRIHLVLDHL